MEQSANPATKMEDNIWLAGCMPFHIEHIRTYLACVKALGEKKKTYTGISVHWSVYKFNSFHRGSIATPVPEKAWGREV